jgi:serine/threonine protein kinase
MSLIFENLCSNNICDKNEETEQDIGNCKEDFVPLKILYKDKDEYYQYLKVKSKKNTKIYLMKILKKKQGEQNSEGKHSIVEILVLKELKHKNIIKYYIDFFDNENYYLLMEYTNFRNLYDFYLTYRNLGKNIEEEIIWKILYQCLDVLVYIHNEGIIHREIEPKNILIDENYNIKLINFNKCAAMDRPCAKYYANNDRKVEKLIVNAGSKILNEYSAPEIEKGDFYSAKIDVFSLGEVINLLFEKRINLSQNNINYYTELKDIISQMRKEPEKRQT